MCDTAVASTVSHYLYFIIEKRTPYMKPLKQVNAKLILAACMLFVTSAFIRHVLTKITNEHIKQRNCSFYK